MRRIDVIAIGITIFTAGGVAYLFFETVGFDGISAGICSQSLLIIGLVGWTLTYLFRVMGKKMTYNQQVKDYEDAVLQKRLEAMSSEELEKLQ
ncbi:MAG: DUF3007 family protein [cyanobacterium endosymbiont of Epithemia adnata isolate EadnSB Bon19]|uniref:DUF3007 family protein n=1 Tax=cyanobacterium endosymbiont of Epithemia turgida TaxID=718217 RepID=UPI0004D1A63F|nr:DUF3007 family protein [cyanobacterium endosymbiont of Epithemia turgida]BAP17888.1 hypothetical protein ETSB_1113 [cyanobacterium endosymbiont of Epithemia turgida isolate EtSB Lake Yunoko]